MRTNSGTWVVTGGGDGLGRELVLQLLARGARVAALDMRPEALAETARIAATADRLSTHQVDITDRAAVEALPPEIRKIHGSIDGLINNAGIMQPFVPVAELDFPTIEKVLAVNLMGTLNVTKAFLPDLLERPSAHICNVGSMGGFFPFPGQTVYGASKAAVKLLSEGLYAELLDSGVGVTIAMPGGMATNIAQHSGVAAPEAGNSKYPVTPVDAAAATILKGIDRGKLHVYVGRDAQAMHLAIKLAPRASIRFVRNQMAKMLQPAGSR